MRSHNSYYTIAITREVSGASLFTFFVAKLGGAYSDNVAVFEKVLRNWLRVDGHAVLAAPVNHTSHLAVRDNNSMPTTDAGSFKLDVIVSRATDSKAIFE